MDRAQKTWEDLPMVLTVYEVRDLLNLSEASIYRYIKRGILPSVKIGGNYRFLRDEMRRYLETGTK